GAMRALLQNKASLLPVGVLAVDGRFARADIVEVKDSRGRLLGRGQTNYSSDECRLILGLQSDQIAQTLGFIGYDALINRQNMSIAPAVLTPDSQRPSPD